jgi:hypothetical protein
MEAVRLLNLDTESHEAEVSAAASLVLVAGC